MRRSPRAGLAGIVLLALAAAGLTGACGSGSSAEGSATTAPAPSTTSTTSPAVVKDVLGTDQDPPGAPGRTLTLIRYTIPAGAKLAPHIHPGVQLAAIRSGVLTYTVVEGTATVRRKGSDRDEAVAAPATIELRPGDAVTEVDGMVHYGANDTDQPVVIEATLLTKDGDDLAVPVTTTTTP